MSTAYDADLRATPAGAADVGKPKRKRGKKADKDPNAPKRPLTAYFLFSQEARADIKGEMDEPTNKEVNDEVLKQWNEMNEDQKQVSLARSFSIVLVAVLTRSLGLERQVRSQSP